MQADYVFKVVVLGDSGVGKTSFVHSLQNNNTCTKGSTIGVDFSVTTIQVGDKQIKAQIWDTAGQEQFRSISRSYFRNVAGALLFYDVSNKESYKNIESWVHDLTSNDVPIQAITCIANKVDLGTPMLQNKWNLQVLSNTIKEHGCSRKVFTTFMTHLYELYRKGEIHSGIKCLELPTPSIQLREKHTSYWICSL